MRPSSRNELGAREMFGISCGRFSQCSSRRSNMYGPHAAPASRNSARSFGNFSSTPPHTTVDAGLDAIRLDDGRMLLAFNDSETGRENLRLALSTDEGRTWTRIATLAEESGADFSYPFLMQASNGDVHLVYTWKRTAIRHVVFNTSWVDGWLARRWLR